MANRTFYRQQNTYSRELVFVPLTINIAVDNSVSSVTAGEGANGISAVRTAAGTYEVRFTDRFPQHLASTFTIQAATAIDRTIQIASVNLSTGAIQIRELLGAVATDVGAVHAIHCMIVFSNV